MSDIELVIKIPEGLTKKERWYTCDEEIWVLIKAAQNGTPLPKGHGRLIDADDIALIDEQFYTPSDYYVAEGAIEDAPTIIEKDGD